MRRFMNTRVNKPDPIDVSILIAIPSTESWEAQFGMALAGLMFYLAQVPVLPNVRKQQVSLINRRASMLSQSRESLLDEGFDRGCTHILWLDSDMVFPEDTIHRLMAHNRTFVGANYVRKTIPASPVTAALGGGLTFTDANSTGLEEVLHIGLGVCLLRLEDIKEIKAPRFTMAWDDDLKCYGGEDVFFAKKLREAGVPCYVDHDLSLEVSHVGRFNFDHTVVGDIAQIVENDVDAEEEYQDMIARNQNA